MIKLLSSQLMTGHLGADCMSLGLENQIFGGTVSHPLYLVQPEPVGGTWLRATVSSQR